jgi:hypothetical protein
VTSKSTLTLSSPSHLASGTGYSAGPSLSLPSPTATPLLHPPPPNRRAVLLLPHRRGRVAPPCQAGLARCPRPSPAAAISAPAVSSARCPRHHRPPLWTSRLVTSRWPVPPDPPPPEVISAVSRRHGHTVSCICPHIVYLICRIEDELVCNYHVLTSIMRW